MKDDKDDFTALHSYQLESMGIPNSLHKSLSQDLRKTLVLDNAHECYALHLLNACDSNYRTALQEDDGSSSLPLRMIVIPYIASWEIAKVDGLLECLNLLTMQALGRIVHGWKEVLAKEVVLKNTKQDYMNFILQCAWSRVILYRDESGVVKAGLPCPPYFSHRSSSEEDGEDNECLEGPFPFIYYPSSSCAPFCCSVGFFASPASPSLSSKTCDLVPKWMYPDERVRNIRLVAILGPEGVSACVLNGVKAMYSDFMDQLKIRRQGYLTHPPSMVPCHTPKQPKSEKVWMVYTEPSDFFELHHATGGLSDPRFAFTTDISNADIIFASQCIFSPSNTHLQSQRRNDALINQFPYEGAYCQKDHLAREIQNQFGYPFPDWAMESYDLDVQLGQFVGRCVAAADEDEEKPLWIIKPAKGTQSKGHFISNDTAHIVKVIDSGVGGSRVAQRYIKHPVCYNNRKVDCRCIVLMKPPSSPDSNTPQLFMHKRVYFRIANKVHAVETPIQRLDIQSTLTAMHLLLPNQSQAHDHPVDDKQKHPNPIDYKTIATLESTYPGKFSWNDIILPKIHDLTVQLFTNMTKSYPKILSSSNSRAMYGLDIMFEIQPDDRSIQPKLTEVTYCPANNSVCDAYEHDEVDERFTNELFRVLFLDEDEESNHFDRIL